MREIKFRAWDGKRMYSPILQDGRIYRNYMDYENDIDYTDIIMQSVGLKDCDDVEIYEGDIVEIVGWEKEYYEVVFHDFGFKLKNLLKKPLFWESRYSDFYKAEFSIVGNKYQNPQLLEIK